MGNEGEKMTHSSQKKKRALSPARSQKQEKGIDRKECTECKLSKISGECSMDPLPTTKIDGRCSLFVHMDQRNMWEQSLHRYMEKADGIQPIAELENSGELRILAWFDERFDKYFYAENPRDPQRASIAATENAQQLQEFLEYGRDELTYRGRERIERAKEKVIQ